MIAFKVVMPAKAQYTQSCRMMAAQTRIAAMKKKMIAVLRYHSGDELVRFCSSAIKTSTTKDTKDHEGIPY